MDNQSKTLFFQIEEAKWIDSVIAPLLPQRLARFVKKNGNNLPGRLAHFVVDYFYIGKWMRVRIERSRQMELIGGKGRKGFRDAPQKMMVKTITSKIYYRGTAIAQKAFDVQIKINQQN